MGDEYTINEKTTRTSDYNQSSDQVSASTDVTTNKGTRVSSGSQTGGSTQQGEQKEFVNLGCTVSFSVKIRGGFPSVPGNC